MKAKTFLGSFTILATAVAAMSASAYVPPSGFQVSQLAKRHRPLKSLRVKTRITGASTQIREIGYYDAATKTFKARFLDQEDHELYAFERKLGSNDSLASLLLFETNTNTLIHALKGAGIPVVGDSELAPLPGEAERRAVEKTSIGRLDKKVGWVIGEGAPSLWILKDEFVPLKLLYGGLEIRFEETKTVREFPYPRAISVYRGGEPVLKGEVMELMPTADLADMKAIHVQGLPAISSALSADQRALIEQWVQWIR
jgi:hypothetical protein